MPPPRRAPANESAQETQSTATEQLRTNADDSAAADTSGNVTDTAPPLRPFAYTPHLHKVPASRRLQDFASRHLSPDPAIACHLQTFEAGGGGDCFFHSVAAALELMLQSNTPAAQHVLAHLPQEHSLSLFYSKNTAVAFLRDTSANALRSWNPWTLLDYLLRAAMSKRFGSFEDTWDPELLLRQHGFDCLFDEETIAESVLAFETHPSGDATLRVAFALADGGAGDARRAVSLCPTG